MQTGEVYHIYKQACTNVGQQFLTSRRISGIISNLDMLGLITAKTISRGRYGRSKEINSCIPTNINPSDVMAKQSLLSMRFSLLNIVTNLDFEQNLVNLCYAKTLNRASRSNGP